MHDEHPSPSVARRDLELPFTCVEREGGKDRRFTMHPDFWHQRWADNQIGFHQPAPTPLLLKHWPSLGVPAGATARR